MNAGQGSGVSDFMHSMGAVAVCPRSGSYRTEPGGEVQGLAVYSHGIALFQRRNKRSNARKERRTKSVNRFASLQKAAAQHSSLGFSTEPDDDTYSCHTPPPPFPPFAAQQANRKQNHEEERQQAAQSTLALSI